ncbi:hypothetical protein ACROYT_G004652 [Oculina patagonica]
MLDYKTRIAYYNGLVLPHFDYDDVVWGDQPGLKSDMDRLQAFQNRFAKRIMGNKMSSNEALEHLKWIPLAGRRFGHRCCAVQNAIKGDIPENVNIFKTTMNDSHGYSTRNSYLPRLPKIRTDWGKRVTSYKCTIDWSSLPDEKAVDVIVVLAHWGRQYTPRMNNLQKQVAHHLTSLGVQLIIGCHPHVEQPYSYHGNRFVAYSLGNLVFLHSMTPEKYTHPTFSLNATRHGRLVRAEVSRRGVTRAQYLPYEIRVNQTNHCIQPTPLSNAAWIDVCGQTDTACLKDIDDTCHL